MQRIERDREVALVPFGGRRWIVAFQGFASGSLDEAGAKDKFAVRLREGGFELGAPE